MKKTLSLLIVIAVCFSFFGCKKNVEPVKKYYTEKVLFNIYSKDSINMPSSLTSLTIGAGETVSSLLDEAGYIITKKSTVDGTSLYGLYTTSGVKIFDAVCDMIYYEFNTVVVIKNTTTTLINTANNKQIEFTTGYAKPLYNNRIAFYPTSPSHHILIKDYDNNTLFTIRDDSRNLEDIVNYGRYLVYLNVQFNEYEVYNLDGEIIFTQSKTNTNSLYYIYNDLLLYINVYYDMQGEHIANETINLTNNTRTTVNLLNPIVSVRNAAFGDSYIDEGYSMFTTKTSTYYANSTMNSEYISPHKEAGVVLVDDRALYYDTSYDTVTIFAKNLSLVSTINNVLNPVYNNGYITLAKANENSSNLSYGIVDFRANLIVPYSFTRIYAVVNSTAIAYNEDATGTRTYYKLHISGSTYTATEIATPYAHDTGILYYLENGQINIYNYNDVLLGTYNNTEIIYNINNENIPYLTIEGTGNTQIVILK